ncbi:MAG: hypothetical protein HGA55_05800, partial [Methanoregulaceae archaeon]|nr:hypothetical protein [Methanoregulaceae archaeon]
MTGRDPDPEEQAGESGQKPDDDIIRIEKITKIFQNARTVVAVDDVSLTV